MSASSKSRPSANESSTSAVGTASEAETEADTEVGARECDVVVDEADAGATKVPLLRSEPAALMLNCAVVANDEG